MKALDLEGQSSASKTSTGALAAYGCLMLYQSLMAFWAAVGSKALSSSSSSSEPLPVSVFLFGRHLVASASLAALGFATHGRKGMIPQEEHRVRVFVAGVLAQCASPMFYLYGLQFVAPTIASIFDGPCVPLMVYAMAVVVGAEVMPAALNNRLKVLGGLAMASGGAVLLIVASGGQESDAGGTGGEEGEMFNVAIFSLFLEAACLSASLIMQKPIANLYPLFPYSFWICFGGLMGCVFHLMFIGDGLLAGFSALRIACAENHGIFFALLYNAYALTLINTLCLSYANSMLPSSTVALGACVQPALTLALDIFIYGADLRMMHIVGIAGIALGLNLFLKSSSQT